MIPVILNSQTCYLIDDFPDWQSGFVVEASIPASYERGLTGRETRRAIGDTLRLTCKFSVVLKSLASIAMLRNSLQGLNVQNVLCPFWPAQFRGGDTLLISGSYYAKFDNDFVFQSIKTHSEIVALESCDEDYLYVPLMVGILAENPDPTMMSGGSMQVQFNFADNGNYPLTPVAFEAPDGLEASDEVRPLFPFAPDWSSLPTSGGSEQDVKRRPLGNLRTLATAYYAQRGRRTCQQGFRLAQTEAFNLLSFFHSMRGEQNPFWIGAALIETTLAADLASGAATMTVKNGAALGTNSFILLGDDDSRVPLAVSGVVGNVWSLVSAPGKDFAADSAIVESLVLARFDNLKLRIGFMSPAYATTQIQFKELPWETNAVGGETYGITMGALPPTASFFKFSIVTPSETLTWRFTNYERDLSDGINDWLSAPMEFDSIRETYDLKRNETTITSRNFTGNPLTFLFPMTLEWPLSVEIYEANIAPDTDIASNFQKYFYGEVSSGDYEPPFIMAKCATLSHIFDRNVPRRLYQRTDNWCLFEPANGLNIADWQWNAKVVNYDHTNAQLIVGTITSTNAAAIEVNYFAYGYLVVTSAAGKKQVRMISSNAVPAGGELTIYLSDFLTEEPAVDDVVVIYPGYDGQAATAKDKFNNYQGNFGGFPFIPLGNPTVLRITSAGGGGKK